MAVSTEKWEWHIESQFENSAESDMTHSRQDESETRFEGSTQKRPNRTWLGVDSAESAESRYDSDRLGRAKADSIKKKTQTYLGSRPTPPARLSSPPLPRLRRH